MSAFFHGRWRKMGAATLGLACVFTAAWLRSVSTADFVLFPTINKTNCQLVSSRCRLTLSFSGGDSFESAGWNSEPVYDGLPNGLEHPEWREHRWRFFGFDYSQEPISSHGWSPLIIEYTVPYWSIVMPLALLSADLLLIKPRSKLNQAVPHE